MNEFFYKLFFFKTFTKDMLIDLREGEWNIDDVRETLIGCLLYTTGDQNHNLGIMPWPGIEPTTFWYAGQRSIQLSNLVRAPYIFCYHIVCALYVHLVSLFVKDSMFKSCLNITVYNISKKFFHLLYLSSDVHLVKKCGFSFLPKFPISYPSP